MKGCGGPQVSCQHFSVKFVEIFFHAAISIFWMTNFYFMAMTNPFVTTQNVLL